MMRPESPLAMGTAGVTRNTSQMLKITDKITQALHDFDKLYDPAEEDEMISSVLCQIDCLESGPLKYQMREFVNKYRDITLQSDERRTERNEILESLMQWFNAYTFSKDFEDISADEALDESQQILQDELLDTKLAFDKMQKVNTEMQAMTETGLDVSHLEREAKALRQKAVMCFRKYQTTAVGVKQDQEFKVEEKVKTEVTQAWKNAALEITGLLTNVRQEGGEYIVELERKIRKLTGDVDERAYMYDKMSLKIKEYKSLEQKWKNDNMMMIDEKATLINKLRKYKKELKKALKNLSKYETVTKLEFLEEDDADEEKEDSPMVHAKKEEAKRKKEEASAAPINLTGVTDPTILKAQLKDTRNQIEKMKLENEELESKITELQEALDDKEDDVLKLMRDKEELMHQMKQNSLRPDTRRLSTVDNVTAKHSSSRSINGALTVASVKMSGEHIQPKASITGGKKCCKCGLEQSGEGKPKPKNKPTERVPSKTNKTTSAVATGTLVKSDSTVSNNVSEVNTENTSSSESIVIGNSHSADERAAMTVKIKTKEQEVESLSSKIHELTEKIATLQQELSAAHQTIGKLEAKLQQKDKQVKELIKLTKEMNNELEQRDRDEAYGVVRETLPEKPEYSEEDGIEVTDKGHKDDEEEEETDIFFKKRIKRKLKEAYVICHRSAQTDPKLDPLGPWSSKKNKGAEEGESNILPPDQWINFDPEAAGISVPHDDPVVHAMLQGAEPEEVKKQSEQCTSMVQRELHRMNQGINGFIEYTNALVEKETRNMAQANKKLKRVLAADRVNEINKQIHTETQLHAIDEKPEAHDTKGQTEEDVKAMVRKAGQESLITLQRALQLVDQALKNQQEEYEQIFKSLKDHPSFKKKASDNVEILPVAKRSKSHSDLINESTMQSTSGAQTSGAKQVTKSRSQSVMRKTMIQEFLFGDTTVLPELEVDEFTKETVKVAVGKASLTKKGPIMLTTTKTPTKPSIGSFFKPTEPIGRKFKPNPLNHTKLRKKQDDLMLRTSLQHKAQQGSSMNLPQTSPGANNKRRKESVVTEKRVLTDFELPSDFFSEYTVAELEKTATEFVDSVKQQRHEEILEKTALPIVTRDLLPKLPITGGNKTNKSQNKSTKMKAEHLND